MPYNNSKGPNMESAKQERKDLLRDNPVVRDMDSSRPWMSKHFQSTMGSAAKMGHESPSEMGHESPSEMEYGGPQMGHEDSPAEKALKGDQGKLNAGLRAAIEAAPEMGYGMEMRDGMEMGHESSPAEKHCMGPRMKTPVMNKEEKDKEEKETGKPNPNPKEDKEVQVMTPPQRPKPEPPAGFFGKKLEKKIFRKV